MIDYNKLENLAVESRRDFDNIMIPLTKSLRKMIPDCNQLIIFTVMALMILYLLEEYAVYTNDKIYSILQMSNGMLLAILAAIINVNCTNR